ALRGRGCLSVTATKHEAKPNTKNVVNTNKIFFMVIYLTIVVSVLTGDGASFGATEFDDPFLLLSETSTPAPARTAQEEKVIAANTAVTIRMFFIAYNI